VNLLARANPDEIDALADLGDRLRQAQASLSGDELRLLTRERHKFIVSLARQARSLASDHGHPLSPTAGRQVEETLNAALADPDAAAAVASGRLVRPLEHTGLGPIDLGGAAAGVGASAAEQIRAVSKAGPETGASAESHLEAELEQTQAEAAAAEGQLRSAEEAAGAAASASEAASHATVEAEGEVRRLEGLLDSARSRAEAARLEAALAWRSGQDADRSVEMARRRVSEARERLTAIERRRPWAAK
jgi:hypothetical protein